MTEQYLNQTHEADVKTKKLDKMLTDFDKTNESVKKDVDGLYKSADKTTKTMKASNVAAVASLALLAGAAIAGAATTSVALPIALAGASIVAAAGSVAALGVGVVQGALTYHKYRKLEKRKPEIEKANQRLKEAEKLLPEVEQLQAKQAQRPPEHIEFERQANKNIIPLNKALAKASKEREAEMKEMRKPVDITEVYPEMKAEMAKRRGR